MYEIKYLVELCICILYEHKSNYILYKTVHIFRMKFVKIFYFWSVKIIMKHPRKESGGVPFQLE